MFKVREDYEWIRSMRVDCARTAQIQRILGWGKVGANWNKAEVVIIMKVYDENPSSQLPNV